MKRLKRGFWSRPGFRSWPMWGRANCVWWPGDCSYDPSDAAAVAVYWAGATIKRGRCRPTVAVKRAMLNMRVDTEVLQLFEPIRKQKENPTNPQSVRD